jgi:hypothetical protein
MDLITGLVMVVAAGAALGLKSVGGEPHGHL